MSEDICRQDVYQYGEVLGVFALDRSTAEELCRALSAATGWLIDWHFIGGRVVMKYIKSDSRPVTDIGKRIEQQLKEWNRDHLQEGKTMSLENISAGLDKLHRTLDQAIAAERRDAKTLSDMQNSTIEDLSKPSPVVEAAVAWFNARNSNPGPQPWTASDQVLWATVHAYLEKGKAT